MNRWSFDRTAFSDRVEQERINRGLTITRMAKEVGTSPSHMSVLRGGYIAPSVDALCKYLKWLGDTDMAAFITTEDTRTAPQPPGSRRHEVRPNVADKQLPPAPPAAQPHSGQLDILHYLDVESCTFHTLWSVEDGQFVATCDQLPSLSWLADTEKAALDGLKQMMHGMQIRQVEGD